MSSRKPHCNGGDHAGCIGSSTCASDDPDCTWTVSNLRTHVRDVVGKVPEATKSALLKQIVRTRDILSTHAQNQSDFANDFARNIFKSLG